MNWFQLGLNIFRKKTEASDLIARRNVNFVLLKSNISPCNGGNAQATKHCPGKTGGAIALIQKRVTNINNISKQIY